MSCCICQKTKTTQVCGICQGDLCKSCTYFLEADVISFLKKVPADLSHTSYCGTCFNEKVSEPLEKLLALQEAAKQVLVFDKSQGKETRLLKRLEPKIHVKECPDRDETVLRLAFLAAQAGFNAIIDMDIVARKIIDGAYQTTVWSGSAVPINVSPEKLVKDRSIWSNPN